MPRRVGLETQPGPAEAIIDLYSRRALDFDADRGRDLVEKAWLDRFLGHVPVAGTVLDLGCGSGEPIARYLIGQGRALIGVDAAPGLISLCRERFPGHAWIVGDMRALDLERRFDGVIAWHSLIHLPPSEQDPIFDVFARHLAPDGVLMFTSGSEHGETVGAWRGEPLYHGSLAADAYRAALDRTGFDLLDHRIGDPDCGGATVWLARRRVSD